MIARAAMLFALWSALIGAGIADAIAGAAVALVSARASLWLLPPGAVRVRPIAAASLARHLLGQAIAAGLDVARRALSPSLPIRPGFVSHPLRLPAGTARDAFCALTSLLPGTVPVGTDSHGTLLIHGLDLDQPIAAQLAADEARFARAIGERGDD